MSVDEHEAIARARVGHVLDGKWQLVRLLGVGGMAAVYEGRHRNAARGAVKILHAEYGQSPETRERFLREGYAANRVEHRSVVRVLDDDVVREGEDAGAVYLVMELLEGESLFGRMRRLGHALGPDDVLALADVVLDVLAAAHANGIIHRDLKPDNVFLAGDPAHPVADLDVKVLDFGIARIAESAGKTRVGTMLGTLSYMPPEQARGVRDLDGRADLYALGATMFRALTGKRVHDVTGDELLTRVATTPAPPIRSVYAGVPEPLAAIVDRALRFAREDRYPDAASMLADVRAARAGAALPSLSLREAPTRSQRDEATTRMDAFLPIATEPTQGPEGRPEPARHEVIPAPAITPPIDVRRGSSRPPPSTQARVAPPLATAPNVAPNARPATSSPARWPWIALGVVALGGLIALAARLSHGEAPTKAPEPQEPVAIEESKPERKSAIPETAPKSASTARTQAQPKPPTAASSESRPSLAAPALVGTNATAGTAAPSPVPAAPTAPGHGHGRPR